VVFAVHQQSPAVAVRLQVVDVGARDFHRAHRLETERPEQRAIAEVLELLVVRHGAKQQRQLDFRQVAEVFGGTAIARGADADGRIVRAEAALVVRRASSR
jgi:hypothetical protein